MNRDVVMAAPDSVRRSGGARARYRVMKQFIEPVFQPIADAHGRTFGLEALLRLQR